jgi:hypothetical protein
MRGSERAFDGVTGFATRLNSSKSGAANARRGILGLHLFILAIQHAFDSLGIFGLVRGYELPQRFEEEIFFPRRRHPDLMEHFLTRHLLAARQFVQVCTPSYAPSSGADSFLCGSLARSPSRSPSRRRR